MSPKNLTVVERQILANQFQILASLESEDTEYQKKEYNNKATILERGYTGLYKEVFTNIWEEEFASEITDEVHSILAMYRTIEPSIEKLSDSEVEALDINAIEFEGFDGNNDKHYGQASFMIKELGLYDEFRQRELNSHTSFSLAKYRKMLSVFEELRRDRVTLLTQEHLQRLIDVVKK